MELLKMDEADASPGCFLQIYGLWNEKNTVKTKFCFQKTFIPGEAL
jgi:hypothetical protein